MLAGSARNRSITPIRVMVVDDSIVARAVLVRMLEAEPDIVVVAQAGTGRAALAALATHDVDIVLLDLEMPEMGGLETLPEILARGAAHRVLVVSSACSDEAEASLHALRLGAADTLLKPGAGRLAGAFARELIERVRRIAAVPLSTDEPVAKAAIPASSPRLDREPPSGSIACIAIGASTGGVHALAQFFAALPRTIETPILITQHLPPPFMPYFAGQLQDMSGRRTRLAVDGMELDAGTILLAPGEAHLGLVRTRGKPHVRLERRRMPSGCMPSVDPMLTGLANVFGAAGLGVILSGMGRDGELGAVDLVAAGGEVLAQDAASSVVWGMPGVVFGAGLARLALPPKALAAEVARRVEAKRVPAWT